MRGGFGTKGDGTAMNALQHIVRIQDLLEDWRALGSLRLRNGVELIGRVPDEDASVWMHVVFPRLRGELLAHLERQLGTPLPQSLRAFYGCCGGMSLFLGAFTLRGLRRPGFGLGSGALQPEDIVSLNHELDGQGWTPRGAVAFAENALDLSVHLVGMGETPAQVVRCERSTGKVLERHDDVFACVDARLYRLDEMQLR